MNSQSTMKGFNVLGLFTLLLLGMGSLLLVVYSYAEEQPSSTEQTDVDKPKEVKPFKHPVLINEPDGPPRIKTDIKDPHGNLVTVACSTCHNTKIPNAKTRKTVELDEFHQKLPYSHGNLTCLSCHNSEDYDSLKLADGSRVEYSNVMKLCAQCHATQTRDYNHGAHGGMTGHWDLTKGPRQRNNCVDCHQPHAPAFPKMQPTFKPRDRFLNHSDVKQGEKHD